MCGCEFAVNLTIVEMRRKKKEKFTTFYRQAEVQAAIASCSKRVSVVNVNVAHCTMNATHRASEQARASTKFAMFLLMNLYFQVGEFQCLS